MKAISIRQPWAWAIMHAGKDVENRNWPTSFRGTVAIHAAKGMTNDEYDEFYFLIREMDGVDAWRTFGPKESLVRGAILGTAEIFDCVRDSASPWFFGEYGFVLRNIKLLETPFPCSGALSFWNVPIEIEERLYKL